MLVLSRKPGEKIVLSEGITITVVQIIGNRIRIGIDSPADVRILRGELTWTSAPEQTEVAAQPTLELPSPSTP